MRPWLGRSGCLGIRNYSLNDDKQRLERRASRILKPSKYTAAYTNPEISVQSSLLIVIGQLSYTTGFLLDIRISKLNRVFPWDTVIGDKIIKKTRVNTKVSRHI